jgi:hypothetical protein
MVEGCAVSSFKIESRTIRLIPDISYAFAVTLVERRSSFQSFSVWSA